MESEWITSVRSINFLRNRYTTHRTDYIFVEDDSETWIFFLLHFTIISREKEIVVCPLHMFSLFTLHTVTHHFSKGYPKRFDESPSHSSYPIKGTSIVITHSYLVIFFLLISSSHRSSSLFIFSLHFIPLSWSKQLILLFSIWSFSLWPLTLSILSYLRSRRILLGHIFDFTFFLISININ